MNVKYLESFLEVAKDLNMTTAAQRLYISQQTLSFQIQRLELYYGVKLFERQPKLQLTYAGKQLVEGAGVIIKENESLINSFSDISSKHSGLRRMFPYGIARFSQTMAKYFTGTCGGILRRDVTDALRRRSRSADRNPQPL